MCVIQYFSDTFYINKMVFQQIYIKNRSKFLLIEVLPTPYFFLFEFKNIQKWKNKKYYQKNYQSQVDHIFMQKRNIKSYLLMDKEKGSHGLISKKQFDVLVENQEILPSDYVDIVKYALKNWTISKADGKLKQKLCQPHLKNPDKIPPPHRLLDHIKETLCSLIEAQNDEDQELAKQQQKELNESILFFEAQNPPNTYQTLIDFQLKGSDEFYIEKQLTETRLLKVKKEIKNKANQIAKKNYQQIEAQKKKQITEKSADKSFQKKQKPSQINLSNEKKSQKKIEQKEEQLESQSGKLMNGKNTQKIITFEKIKLVQQKRQKVQKTCLMNKQEDQKAQKIKKLFLFQSQNQQEAKQ